MSSILKVDTIQDADGNNIINENDNTITIGASGDNITIPSGATFTSVGIDDNADATAITIDSSERVGIGTTTPGVKLEIKGADGDADAQAIRLMENSTQGGFIKYDGNVNELQLGGFNSGENTGIRIARNDATTHFNTNGAERMRIDDSGNVGIGTTSPAEKLDVYRSGSGITTRFGKDSIFGELRVGGDSVGFTGTRTAGTADNAISGYFINNDINSGTSRFEYLTLKTVNTERMRIHSNGRQTYNGSSTVSGHANFVGEVGASYNALAFEHTNGGGIVGTVRTTASSTAYNTSSDYRLKENVSYDFDATTRLKQLKPARFNFIADANTTVDGFLAHEVSSVVPEAISGTKDAVQVWEEGDELPEGVSVGDNKLDENGNTIPVYQGIDQSKLVPLLVKTIQELEARITTLETKVQTLENNQP